MIKKINAYLFIVVAVCLFGATYSSAVASDLTWFNNSQELELVLAKEGATKPQINFWNIPCTTIQHSTRSSNGTLQQSEGCANYTDFGYIIGTQIMLAGTNSSHRISLQGTHSYMTGFLAPIPGTNNVIHFNSKMNVYKNLPSKISAEYSLSPATFGQITKYKINDTPTEHNQVKYRDGVVLSSIKSKGFSFSKKGGKIVVNVGSYQALIDTSTYTAKRFGRNSIASGYSTSQMTTSLNSNGTVALTNNAQPSSHSLYNLENCIETVAGMPEQCEERRIQEIIKSKLGTSAEITYSQFLTDELIELYIDLTVDGVRRTNKYFLKIPGASSAGMQYLALGDSYASGEGAHDYRLNTDTDSNSCHIAKSSYPYLISGLLQYAAAESVACSGAAMKDVVNINRKNYIADNPQAKEKDSDIYNNDIFTNFLPGYRRQHAFVENKKPEAITLSIGGNDINFGKKLEKCIMNPLGCYGSEEEKKMLLKEIQAQFNNLFKTYQYFKLNSPETRVYVVGYPKIAMPGGNCATNVLLNNSEIQLAEDIVADLNGTIKLAAKKAGVFYVDASDAFKGHRLCEDESWKLAMNGLTAGGDMGPRLSIGDQSITLRFLGKESYHPNKLGHVLYKNTILAQTNNLTAPMPEPDDTVLPNQLQSKLVPGESSNLVDTTTPISVENLTNNDTSLPGEVISRNITVPNQSLKPGTQFEVEVHSTPRTIGAATATSINQIEVDAVLPNDIEPGAHTIHITGLNINNEPIDIYKDIVVYQSEEDFDGDGILNKDDKCHFVEPTNEDLDNDGVDDACDSFITELPPDQSPVPDLSVDSNPFTFDAPSNDNSLTSELGALSSLDSLLTNAFIDPSTSMPKYPNQSRFVNKTVVAMHSNSQAYKCTNIATRITSTGVVAAGAVLALARIKYIS